ncbi:hypothetical protein [Ideonella livida]|uniref:Tail sheath protein n=1 Tax=Ideonella livida TaxID=2707176 RepID=A0A7C9PEB8_9BURK|nr:hypothetical protein [Ideonella livida]NDY89696.1 hypothetical protein [Ideonella livida]
MSGSPFLRQLGYQAGAQLNPLQDKSAQSGNLGMWDRTVGLAMRATRGRIDRPFVVQRADFGILLGDPESMVVNSLNEAKVIGHEALRKGAAGLVVSRLVSSDAVNSWLIFTSGATSDWDVSATTPVPTYSETDVPSFTLALKHLLCHNDGIQVRIHADSGGAKVTTITVMILDSAGLELHRVTGSLDPTKTDDSGNSLYLPDVAERTLGDVFEWVIPDGASIGNGHDGYGKTGGVIKWADSGVQALFDEGESALYAADYGRAVDALTNTDVSYGYLISAGSRSVDLIQGLIDLGYARNRQVIIDIPGDLTPSAAATWADQFALGGTGQDYYPIFLWAPIKAMEVLGGGMSIYGTSGNYAGQACARNAVTNSYGYAAKNRPIAGDDFPLGRVSARVIHTPSAGWDDALSFLAKARINPVLPRAGGGAVVFRDCLTAAATTTSYRKLTSVAEMSSHLAEQVVSMDNASRFLPQAEKKRYLDRQLSSMFAGAAASGWLVTGQDIAGEEIPAYEYDLVLRPVDGVDTLHLTYRVHFDGVNRRTEITQVLR